MPARSKTKLGFICAALAIALGAVAACADLPTEASTNPADCIIIEGIIHCPPGM